LFTYKEQKIISAVPITEIKEYFEELGAIIKPEQTEGSYKPDKLEQQDKTGLKYDFKDLEIEINPYIENGFPDLGIQRHTIIVRGDTTFAEEFLTSFRFRFMTAGG